MDNFKALKAWLQEQVELIKQEHDKGADQQLIMQGRFEAANIILSKMEQLAAAAEETPAAEAKPKKRKSSKKSET